MVDDAALSQDEAMISGARAANASTSARRTISIQAAVLPAALALMAVLLLPMLLAGPSHLTSDESLYLAEAYNIAEGHGLTYPSGDIITHRAPLYPLVLAPAVKAGGVEAAYAVSSAIVAVNALLVLWLAWRLSGPVAGMIGGVAAAASAYLAELGTTLYLDPLQSAFLLLSLIALHWAILSGRMLAFGASGMCVGLAFLTKESAVQWAPLAIITVLAIPSTRNRRGLLGACAYTGCFAACLAPWLVWVYAVSGELFLMGEPGVRALLATGTGVAMSAAVVCAALHPGIAARATTRNVAVTLAGGITIVWCAFILYGLTAYSTWPYPNDYRTTIPEYTLRVGSQVQPFVFIIAAWMLVGLQAARKDERARLLIVAALLLTPFSLFAANRWLQLRDALPLVYLSYVALGLGAGWAWAWFRTRISEPPVLTLAAAAACGLAAVFATHGFLTFQHATEREAVARNAAGSWDSPYTEAVADWMRANIPAGAHVATSRLYFSSLHVGTDARYRIHQLPTVRVDIDARRTPLLEARANLFRWGESEVRPTAAGDTWLHLQQFSGKSYWVGLSQQELFEYIQARRIEYVILTGEDSAFSSNAYAWFLTSHPAFSLLATIEGTGGDLMFGYAVDRSKLDLVDHPTSISPADFEQLVSSTSLSADELSRRLGTKLRVTDVTGGLSDREREAAHAGTAIDGE